MDGLTLFDWRPPSSQPLHAPAGDRFRRMHNAAATLSRLLEQQRAIDRQVLTAVMTDSLQGTEADGSWTIREAYDVAEIAATLLVLKYGQGLRPNARQPAGVLDQLAALVNRLPTQSRRTDQTIHLQQFSSPLTLGWLAARACRLVNTDIVLEPSAGTGHLAVHALSEGCRLILNEIGETRRELLSRALRLDVDATDAQYASSYLAHHPRPTAILMNPPFSADINLDQNSRSNHVGMNHVKAAFQLLTAPGRLVVILGRNSGIDSSLRHDWKWISEHGAIRCDIAIHGGVFRKSGTTFDCRLILVDKGDTAALPTPQVVDSLPQLLGLIDQLPPRRFAVGAVPEPTTSTERTQLPAHLFADPSQRRVAAAQPPAAPKPKPGRIINEILLKETSHPITYDTIEVPPQSDFHDELYEPYVVQRIRIHDACAHPDDLVESSALASVPPPIPTYQPLLPRRWITDGLLSDCQLESTIYFGEASQQWINTTITDYSDSAEGKPRMIRLRAGVMITDGTGVGKGRQVAAIIHDRVARGTRRVVWISKNADLLEDARRDWADLGHDASDIFLLTRIKPAITAFDPTGKRVPIAHDIPHKAGICYVPFGTLRSGEDQTSRVKQLIRWLQEDPECFIIIDEAHEAGNAVATAGKRGKKRASQQGIATMTLQTALPHAYVLYLSATYAGQLQNLAYAIRLGLWGSDMPFQTREDFVAAMSESGLAALELVSRDLKANGRLFARTLSMRGVEYERVEHRLTDEQRALYDSLATAWQSVLAKLDEILKVIGATQANPDGTTTTLNPDLVRAARSKFWGGHQRFFSQIITALKMPTILTTAEADLAAEESVVIQLTNTNEAVLKRALDATKDAEDLENLDLTPMQILVEAVDAIPTIQQIQTEDDQGNKIARNATREVELPDGKTATVFVENSYAVQLKEQLLASISRYNIPDGPLEQLIDHFGPDRVSEITGRTVRVVRNINEGDYVRREEHRSATANLAETQAFVDDKKRILVFSQAGGTGRSYHSDRRFKNQRQRNHYLAQPGWRSEVAIQGLGRTNRTNQASKPRYRLVQTDLKGERRFISTIARRLEALGALTRGQRQAASNGLFSANDNLETPYATKALHQLLTDIAADNIDDFPYDLFQRETGLQLLDPADGHIRSDLPPMTQFLNRCLSMTIDRQNRIFEIFEERLERLIQEAMKAGTYDVGIETFRPASLVKVEEDLLYEHPITRAQAKLVRLRARNPVETISWSDLTAKIGYRKVRFATNLKSKKISAFTEGRPHTSGKTGKVVRLLHQYRPKSERTVHPDELNAAQWETISVEKAKALWEAEHAQLPTFKEDTLYIVTGALLAIWDRLPGYFAHVYRMQTDDGERLLGREIAVAELSETLKKFERALALSPEQIVDAVLSGRLIAVIGSQAWRLTRRRLNDAYRIEVVGPTDYSHGELLRAMGVRVERQGHKSLFYFNPNQAETAQALLERFPVTALNKLDAA